MNAAGLPAASGSIPAPTPLQRVTGTLGALFVVGVVGAADYITGRDVGLALFYLIPVVGSGYLLGMTATCITATTASVMWFLADYMLREQGALWVSLWNASTRLAIFVGVGLLTARVNADRRRLQALLAHEHVLSRTDALTGLANSRGLLEAFGRELARAERGEATACAVVFFDLDNFKHINDRFGHAEGDRVLREVAQLLSRAVRGTDVAARMGGDEFVALLWDVDEMRARQVAERVVD